MEQLKNRYNMIVRALDTLKVAIDKLQNSQCCASEEEYRTFRDSEIKRFEICTDTLWKYLKLYLETKKGVLQTSPKPVFRECLRSQIITDEKEVALAIEMVDARNATSHIYKEEIAEQIHAHIPVYYQLMEKLLKLTKPLI